MTEQFLINRDHRTVVVWLFVCMLFVAAMVTVGGYTRLVGAGLSITEWKPIYGTVPPASDEEWAAEFSSYQQSPQFQKVNSTMTLEEFKNIYWPEYFHRLLGRLTGIAVLIPLIVFIVRRSLSRPVVMHIGGIFLLVALQGFMGWFMVKSGLADNPRVSHIRLATHLTIAFTIFGLLEWLWLSLMVEHGWWKKKPRAPLPPSSVDPLTLFVLWLFFFCLQILFGAFMAGLHAGFAYNTWPTMNGKWIPESFAGDVELIQFIHRWLAAVVVGGFFVWWITCWRHIQNIQLTGACMTMGLLLCAQFLLGVLTLIEIVPLHLALPHQLMALVLFSGSLYLLHKLVDEVQSA
jgi:heme a synthase